MLMAISHQELEIAISRKYVNNKKVPQLPGYGLCIIVSLVLLALKVQMHFILHWEASYLLHKLLSIENWNLSIHVRTCIYLQDHHWSCTCIGIESELININSHKTQQSLSFVPSPLFHRWKLVINDLSQLCCLQQWKAASGFQRAGWSIYCGRVEMDQQWFPLIEMHCGVSKLVILGTNAWCLFLWAFSTVWKSFLATLWCFICMAVLENPHKVDVALWAIAHYA